MDKKTFSLIVGSKIKESRTRKGISQNELAKNYFKDRQYIFKIEKGLITPTIYTTFLICKELDISINEIIPNNS